jgi:hypothetical protein
VSKTVPVPPQKGQIGGLGRITELASTAGSRGLQGAENQLVDAQQVIQQHQHLEGDKQDEDYYNGAENLDFTDVIASAQVAIDALDRAGSGEIACRHADGDFIHGLARASFSELAKVAPCFLLYARITRRAAPVLQLEINVPIPNLFDPVAQGGQAIGAGCGWRRRICHAVIPSVPL